jgi:TPR repeat protein
MGTAVQWYLKSAAAHSPHAQLNLGLCYFHGVGVPKDTAAAAELWRKAAAQGSETAQRALNAHFPGRGKSGGGFQPLTRALSPEARARAHAGALEMNPGTRVRLAGLQSEAGKARNGQAGRCGGKCDSGSGRFHVALDDGFCGKFRPENLEVNI